MRFVLKFCTLLIGVGMGEKRLELSVALLRLLQQQKALLSSGSRTVDFDDLCFLTLSILEVLNGLTGPRKYEEWRG